MFLWMILMGIKGGWMQKGLFLGWCIYYAKEKYLSGFSDEERKDLENGVVCSYKVDDAIRKYRYGLRRITHWQISLMKA